MESTWAHYPERNSGRRGGSHGWPRAAQSSLGGRASLSVQRESHHIMPDLQVYRSNLEPHTLDLTSALFVQCPACPFRLPLGCVFNTLQYLKRSGKLAGSLRADCVGGQAHRERRGHQALGALCEFRHTECFSKGSLNDFCS